ncbi:hypothetical protein MKW98_003008 [Papaver atlanticum]|uniref:Dynamin-type G domain-containing protein n=1 Tax=Papaver atlanticum TaxID=357466 RepID=A0AAD4THI7_9MAGN|nr:hypothetical protein MKW98_003008 [Papaver atlanticum]
MKFPCMNSQTKPKESVHSSTPLISNFNDRIRPMLDAVDKLRHLKVMDEGIQLPTIVVVGDQSSGKSSVLESLAGISLPRGQGICTRVPLIMRLQNHSSPEPKFHLEYHGKKVPTDEASISEAISSATDEITGDGKCISNTPLTLVVKKKGVPDLTMVDLPGITRVPVHGQPEDIYEQINNIIMEYIKPKESIILNVLSATVDFPTCESIRMSQKVDKTGERTLAVVTKVDKSPEGLLEKVTADDVNIGLGYVCVRNRIGDETYEEARIEEATLFRSHPLLSKIDKSIVGVPVLAQKLVQIQATSISNCLPDIVKKINEKLNQNAAELNNMPRNLSSIVDSVTEFMRVLGSAKETLRNILITGEFNEFPDDANMHCTARLSEMLDSYAADLESKSPWNNNKDSFLTEEVKVLGETKAFLIILQRRVEVIAETPVQFAHKVWNYVEDVFVRVLVMKSESFPHLQSFTRWAAHNVMTKVRNNSIERVKEIVEMEKMADYSCSPDYISTWTRLMLQQQQFKDVMNDGSKPKKLHFEMLGDVEFGHLKDTQIVQQAFDIKMRLMSYWKIVLRRLNLVNKDMEQDITSELMGGPSDCGGIERMLEESPSVATKREKLNRSIKLLRDSKDVVAKIIGRISLNGERSN